MKKNFDNVRCTNFQIKGFLYSGTLTCSRKLKTLYIMDCDDHVYAWVTVGDTEAEEMVPILHPTSYTFVFSVSRHADMFQEV